MANKTAIRIIWATIDRVKLDPVTTTFPSVWLRIKWWKVDISANKATIRNQAHPARDPCSTVIWILSLRHQHPVVQSQTWSLLIITQQPNHPFPLLRLWLNNVLHSSQIPSTHQWQWQPRHETPSTTLIWRPLPQVSKSNTDTSPIPLSSKSKDLSSISNRLLWRLNKLLCNSSSSKTGPIQRWKRPCIQRSLETTKLAVTATSLFLPINREFCPQIKNSYLSSNWPNSDPIGIHIRTSTVALRQIRQGREY